MSIFDEAMGGQMRGLQFVQQGIAQGKESALAKLAANYAQGGQPDYQGIAANGGNPLQFRNDQQAQHDGQQKAMVERVGKIAGYLAAIPDASQRNVVYSQVRPQLDEFSRAYGLPLPDSLDDSHLPELQALAQMSGAAGTSSAVQEFADMTRGFTPQEVAAARRVKAGLTARAGTESNVPFSQYKYIGADGKEYVEVVDRRDGTSAAPNAPRPQAAGGPNMMDFLSNVQTLGGRVTSGYRTAAEQAALRAAGKTTTVHSQHNDSTGADVVFPNPQAKAQAIAYARANGINVLEEGTHVHFGIPRGVAPAGAGPYASRSAEEQAALNAGATEQAKIDAQVGNAPRVADAEALTKQRIAEAEARVKTQTDRANTQRDADSAFEQYSAGMKTLLDSLGNTSTGYLSGRLPAVTTAQQTADGGVAAMAPVLKALFRQAGEGTFTDKDQALLIGMLPTRTDTPQAAKNKAANIDAIVRAKLRKGGAGGQSNANKPAASNPNRQALLDKY